MFKELNTLKLFFEEPNREFNVREVARLLNNTPATASKQLKEFAKRDILTYRKERILDLYKSNLESDGYRDLKLYYMLKILKESGFVDALNRFYLKPTIVLFGSASFGLDTDASDIDLLIVTENKKEMPNIKKYEKLLKRKIQLFVHKNVLEIENKHLVNNIVNGITLQGTIKWI